MSKPGSGLRVPGLCCALETHFLCFVGLAFERQKREVGCLEADINPLYFGGI